MDSRFKMELTKTAYTLLVDMIKVKPGESVLITTDSVSDMRVAEEIAKVSDAIGAKTMLAWHSTPKGYGAQTMKYLPEPLIACADKTDVWIELNEQWLLYSPMWDKAVQNGRTRQIMLGGLDVERMCRNIGAVDMAVQKEFQDKLQQMTKKSKKVKITNPAGTDITFENHPDRPVTNEMDYSKPGGHFLVGQVGWAPYEPTLNGKIVFDGSFSGGGHMELGLLRGETIAYIVEKGRIVGFEGGKLAPKVEKFYKSFNDENIYMCAHVCYGVLPNAKLEGVTAEDERYWGSTNWGFGHQGSVFSGGEPRVAPGHIDAIALNCSVWLDGVQVFHNGEVVHPELESVARKLGK